jgi:hypothetical protein
MPPLMVEVSSWQSGEVCKVLLCSFMSSLCPTG